MKKKLEENTKLSIKVEKSNAIVIMNLSDYIKKDDDFIRDSSEKYQKELSEALKKCNKVIANEYRP